MRHVLWTGGWDSTFRVLVLLLQQGETVQTHYVLDPSRKSLAWELAAMGRIREAVIARCPDAADRFPPLITAELASIPADEEVARNYRILAARTHAGSQYDWLCRYANSLEAESVELCLEGCRDPTSSHMYSTVRFGGDMVPVATENDFYYTLLEPPLHPEMANFRKIRFPVLDETKLSMSRAAVEGGFADILELTWFCHDPTPDGKPCGVCHPCQQTRKEGLGRRVPPPTLKRRLRLIKSILRERFKFLRRS